MRVKFAAPIQYAREIRCNPIHYAREIRCNQKYHAREIRCKIPDTGAQIDAMTDHNKYQNTRRVEIRCITNNNNWNN